MGMSSKRACALRTRRALGQKKERSTCCLRFPVSRLTSLISWLHNYVAAVRLLVVDRSVVSGTRLCVTHTWQGVVLGNSLTSR